MAFVYHKVKRTGDHISNHLRTWKRKYVKINKLRNLSAAIWDEDNFVISLDHEHFTNHIKDHKSDAEYFNKPIEHYGEMATIFGATVATGKYAKGTDAPLATGIGDNEHTEDGGGDDTTAAAADGETSSVTRPNKRAKTAERVRDDDGLIQAMKDVGERLSSAIEKAGAAQPDDLPPGLYEAVCDLPGFDDTHLSFYHEHLVDRPRKAKAFVSLSFAHKMNWAAKFISETFPPN